MRQSVFDALRGGAIRFISVGLVVMGAIPIQAEVDKPGRDVRRNGAEVDISPTGSQGLVVIRDPESGQLRAPTGEERRDLGLDRFFRRAEGSSRIEVKTDGTLRLVTGSKYMNSLLATKSRSGVRFKCVQGQTGLSESVPERIQEVSREPK